MRAYVRALTLCHRNILWHTSIMQYSHTHIHTVHVNSTWFSSTLHYLHPLHRKCHLSSGICFPLHLVFSYLVMSYWYCQFSFHKTFHLPPISRGFHLLSLALFKFLVNTPHFLRNTSYLQLFTFFQNNPVFLNYILICPFPKVRVCCSINTGNYLFTLSFLFIFSLTSTLSCSLAHSASFPLSLLIYSQAYIFIPLGGFLLPHTIPVLPYASLAIFVVT